MATIESTTPADILFQDEARERLKELEAQRDALTAEIAAVRASLSPLLENVQQIETEQQQLTSPTLEQMLQSPSYKDDERFQPLERDEERAAAFDQRRQTQRSITDQQSTIDRLTRLRKREAELKAIINGNGLFGSLKNFLTGSRKKAGKELKDMKWQFERAPTELNAANAALQIARDRASVDSKNTAYDASLHDIKESIFLPRTEQSVLVEFEASNKWSGLLITLNLPNGPNDTDFPRTLSFNLKDKDFHELLNVLGVDLPVKDSIHDHMYEYFDFSYDMERQLLPFPLELVQVNGQDRTRIPQAIWNKFKQYIV